MQKQIVIDSAQEKIQNFDAAFHFQVKGTIYEFKLPGATLV